MPDFSEFADDAKKLASDHPDMANKGIEEAGQVADEKTGGRFGGQIDEAASSGPRGSWAPTNKATKTRRPETASGDEQPGGRTPSRRMPLCASVLR
jgi:hypothetical protein